MLFQLIRFRLFFVMSDIIAFYILLLVFPAIQVVTGIGAFALQTGRAWD